jgi:hypothetical protein
MKQRRQENDDVPVMISQRDSIAMWFALGVAFVPFGLECLTLGFA